MCVGALVQSLKLRSKLAGTAVAAAAAAAVGTPIALLLRSTVAAYTYTIINISSGARNSGKLHKYVGCPNTFGARN